MTVLNQRDIVLEKLCKAAIKRRLGDIAGLPEELVEYVLKVYREFIASYLNMLRQKDSQPNLYQHAIADILKHGNRLFMPGDKYETTG
ncbi:MAG: hypothetical protein PVF56_01250 [Desulfobacterales bacterium]|jgi:hypothetical protein